MVFASPRSSSSCALPTLRRVPRLANHHNTTPHPLPILNQDTRQARPRPQATSLLLPHNIMYSTVFCFSHLAPHCPATGRVQYGGTSQEVANSCTHARAIGAVTPSLRQRSRTPETARKLGRTGQELGWAGYVQPTYVCNCVMYCTVFYYIRIRHVTYATLPYLAPPRSRARACATRSLSCKTLAEETKCSHTGKVGQGSPHHAVGCSRKKKTRLKTSKLRGRLFLRVRC